MLVLRQRSYRPILETTETFGPAPQNKETPDKVSDHWVLRREMRGLIYWRPHTNTGEEHGSRGMRTLLLFVHDQ